MPKRKKHKPRKPAQPPPPLPVTVKEAGRRGGKARLMTMTPEARSLAAKLAAKTRWDKGKEQDS